MTRRLFAALLSAFIVSVCLSAQAAGPGGNWRVEFATPLGQRAVNMTINQSGARLTGHVSDEYGEYELTGRFADGHVTLIWSVYDDGKMLEITMKGKLENNAIVGTAQLGDVGEGPMTARRTGDAGDLR